MNKDVTYHDEILFNKHVATSILAGNISVTEVDFIKFIKDVQHEDGFISKNFKNVFYKNHENLWLDGFMNKVLSSNLKKEEVSLCLYYVFQACLKKRPFNFSHGANLNLRLKKTYIEISEIFQLGRKHFLN